MNISTKAVASPALDLSARVKAQALALGFDAVGIARADETWTAGARLQEFLDEGRHGAMDWLETTADRRQHPQALWAEAKSAIVLGVNYAPDSDPMDALKEKDRGVISAYARRRDYHDVIKSRLKQLARWLVEEAQTDVKVFVDTAPLMEKPLAQRGGLGWQGKHTNLVSREFGSWLFLGSILTSAELEPDEAETDHCGQCRACLDICPTAAFPAPYKLDARRCIAYLTNEHDGHIDTEFREAIGNRVFGCDDCLAVCPWNKFAKTSQETKLALRETLERVPLEDLAALDDQAFRTLFAGTPVKRTGRERFVRNVLIAIGNASEPRLAPVAERLLADESALIRAMAVWALTRLLDPDALHRLRLSHAGDESDGQVRREWGV